MVTAAGVGGSGAVDDDPGAGVHLREQRREPVVVADVHAAVRGAVVAAWLRDAKSLE
jgi:hypothetical protein